LCELPVKHDAHALTGIATIYSFSWPAVSVKRRCRSGECMVIPFAGATIAVDLGDSHACSEVINRNQYIANRK
jgi:hypothetical protein